MNDFVNNLNVTPFIRRCLNSRNYMLGAFADWNEVLRSEWYHKAPYDLPRLLGIYKLHARVVAALLDELFGMAVRNYTWIAHASYEQQKELQARVSRSAVRLTLACIRLHRVLREYKPLIFERANSDVASDARVLYREAATSIDTALHACCATVSGLHRTLPATLSTSVIKLCARFATDSEIFREVL